MSNGRTFNVLETCCFPKGCLLVDQTLLATVTIPQLEAVGMKPAEWTRGALMFEEPYYSKLRQIVCRPCNMRQCIHNPRNRPLVGLRDLMDGQYGDRVRKGEDLLAQLLPEAKKAELELAGIEVIVHHMPSRKNPRLVFSFARGENNRSVDCEIGDRRLSTNEGSEPLFSLGQVSQKIESAIRSLA